MRTQDTQNISLSPTKNPYIFIVGLKLDFETRYIGRLDKTGDGTFISNKRTEKHLFENLNALGINKELCERFNFRWILVPYCGRKLWTSRLYLLHHGKVLSFGKAGFKTQVFLALDEWSMERAKAFEQALSRQTNLFEEAA